MAKRQGNVSTSARGPVRPGASDMTSVRGTPAYSPLGAHGFDNERALANATVYLDSLGHVVVAWRWLAQGLVAARAKATAANEDFYAGKLAACRFFFRHELPRITPKLVLLRALDDTALAIPDSGF